MHAILRGEDHVELDAVEVAAVTKTLAIGLTRGRHPKSYGYTDPNEDVVMVRVAGDRTALVVADGHSGLQASHIAVDELDRLLGPGLDGLDGRQAPVRALHAVNEVIRGRRRSLPGDARRTRTTLAVAIVDSSAQPRRVRTATVGDSVILAISPTTGARTLTRDRHRFLGDRSSLPEMAGATDLREEVLADDDMLIAATDGLTNFARLDDIGPAAVGATSPSEVVTALIDLAGNGGAGDNVAVAALTPR